ncbi:MAG: ASCH domain-containing protein [Chloroflexi bacterium]|nr:ASCH domain-containing protein [Chloroflexota bacterium]
MDNTPTVIAFWQFFLSTFPDDATPPTTYETWYFGSTKVMANELGNLVLAGTKRATASLVWYYEHAGKIVPKAGDISVITDWSSNPLCVIETTEVSITPFNQVDAQFAFDEGEGDRSLAYWQEGHWRFFLGIPSKVICMSVWIY